MVGRSPDHAGQAGLGSADHDPQPAPAEYGGQPGSQLLGLQLFSGLREGRSCDGGLGFIPERGKQLAPPPGGGWRCGRIVSEADPDVTVSVYFDDAGVGYVSCTRAVFGAAADGRGLVPAWLKRSWSLWFPEYIRFKLDESGIPILP